ncbi:protein IMPACT homolog [Saccostrea cucullata]|uniref:protein IMPACT homolog n=1 Tax=Saccostrea cuccullata TaxID=36930 RepID=UPI002ED5A91E
MPSDRRKTGATSKKQVEECSQKNAGSEPLEDPADNESIVATIQDIKSSVETIRNDLSEGDQSVNAKLKYVSEQSESNYEDISLLRQENAQLRRELELLRSVVIRMDRKMSVIENDVTDLRSRSMRDNILIHNYPFEPNENLTTSMPATFKELLGVDVSFVRIHRNGVRPEYNSDRPVSITAKLTDRSKINTILNAQKLKKIAKQPLPFFITTQQPASIVSARNKVFDTADSLRSQNITVKIQKNQVILPNGSTYKDDVPFLTNADALLVTPEETEHLDSVEIKNSDPIKKDGSEFMAFGARVKNVDDVKKMYSKVLIDPYAASADNRILVYRLSTENGTVHENYHDDSEHGAGRKMLRYMKENNINNAAFVITRWMGDAHIGPQRFSIMEQVINEVANSLEM